MASFDKRMKRRGLQVVTGSNRGKQLAAAAISQTVILATPVDTGQARGNWFASLGRPVTSASSATSKTGASRIGGNAGVIAGALPEVDIYISNNVRHIGPLNNGSSAQAPAGFIQQAVIAGQRSVRKMKVFK